MKRVKRKDGPVVGDWRIVENLLYECIIQGSNDFHQLLSRKRWKWFERERFESWTAELQHDETMRSLFTWCASKLLLPDLRASFLRVIHATTNSDWGFQTTTRALSIVLFRHLWETFTHESKSVQALGAYIVQWVHEITRNMHINCADLFDAIAIALANLVSPMQVACVVKGLEGMKPSQWSAENTFELLKDVHEAALLLVSEDTTFKPLTKSFLAAHATINLTSVPKQAAPPDSMSFSIEGCLPRSIDLRRFALQGPTEAALRTVQHGPPLNPTPRSSMSSGFRSMLSLRNRISSRKQGGSIRDGALLETMSIRSSESWSPRHQLGLSGSSYRTLSSISTRSVQGMAMDWEPAVSGIGE
jgi:hypothetical protein